MSKDVCGSMDFDLSFRAQPDDKSRLTMVMDADTGEITTGKRYAWTQGDRERSDLRMEFREARAARGSGAAGSLPRTESGRASSSGW